VARSETNHGVDERARNYGLFTRVLRKTIAQRLWLAPCSGVDITIVFIVAVGI
jgi:hypothetical protein